MPYSTTPTTDPTQIYRYRDGLYAVDLLGAAIVDLDFFTWLADHPSDPETIRRSLALKARPVDVMLTLFAANGFVESLAGVFRVTALAREFLVKSSPTYMGPYYAALKDRPVCRDMLTVLRTGRPAGWGSLAQQKDWHKAMEDETFADQFTAAMDCRGAYLGPALARQLDCRHHRRLLDIAGGSGIYACAIVDAHSHLKATVLEKPPVDEVARRHIARRGFTDRVSATPGEMFTDKYPGDCDIHLFSNVLHDWDTPQVRQLLARSFDALPPGGMLVIHDALLNATKTGPLAVAEYSTLLMHSSEGRCYSVVEMEELSREAGFGSFKQFPTAVDRSAITATKPA